jgi:hypothetical protein
MGAASLPLVQRTVSKLAHFSADVAVDLGEQAIREEYLILTISFLT